jgi:beta-glucanase (GH16 family)
MPINPRMSVRIMLTALLLSVAVMTARAESGPSGWELVWRDEFDGDRIAPSKWTPCERGRSDWNDTMTSDPRCFHVGEGVLKLIGIVSPDTTKAPSAFLTGGITSKGKFEFRHGKVEVRARFKAARGAWPALWMLGSKGQWPKNGEIDLMEHLNFDGKVYQTIHSYYANEIDKSHKNPPKGTTAPISREEWNTYGAEWDSEKIVFTVNGKPTMTYPKVPEKGAGQWPFDQPFYLIFSMQIGGNWVGKADPKDYPAYMEIDWVRVYREGKPVSANPKD